MRRFPTALFFPSPFLLPLPLPPQSVHSFFTPFQLARHCSLSSPSRSSSLPESRPHPALDSSSISHPLVKQAVRVTDRGEKVARKVVSPSFWKISYASMLGNKLTANEALSLSFSLPFLCLLYRSNPKRGFIVLIIEKNREASSCGFGKGCLSRRNSRLLYTHDQIVDPSTAQQVWNLVEKKWEIEPRINRGVLEIPSLFRRCVDETTSMQRRRYYQHLRVGFTADVTHTHTHIHILKPVKNLLAGCKRESCVAFNERTRREEIAKPGSSPLQTPLNLVSRRLNGGEKRGRKTCGQTGRNNQPTNQPTNPSTSEAGATRVVTHRVRTNEWMNCGCGEIREKFL